MQESFSEKQNKNILKNKKQGLQKVFNKKECFCMVFWAKEIFKSFSKKKGTHEKKASVKRRTL